MARGRALGLPAGRLLLLPLLLRLVLLGLRPFGV